MKLKSFKKKGVSPETAAWELLPEHSNYFIEQIAVDSKQQEIEIMWPYENGGPNLERGDTLAVTIDNGQNIVLARIRKVSMVGDQLLQASIQEHKELDIQSSKQLPSSR